MIEVEYHRSNEWKPTFAMGATPRTVSEAERLASVRSENSGLLYRVRRDDLTLSHWKNGNQTTIARNE